MFKTLILAVTLALGLGAQSFPHTISFTIASGASLSSAVNVREGTHPAGSCTPAAIIMPATWTAASITVQASVDGTTFYDVYDEFGTELTFTAAAARIIKIDAAAMWGVGLVFKFRSGTTGTPVNQATARTLSLICR